MMKCKICNTKAYLDGRSECPRCASLSELDDLKLKKINARLFIALQDAIILPMGVIPSSAEEFLKNKKLGEWRAKCKEH